MPWKVIGLAIAVIAMIVLPAPSLASTETSVASAMRLCEIFDRMEMLSEKCKISGWNASVEISLDTSGQSANEICRGVANNIARYGMKFDRGWLLKIYSPFSAGRTIAVCDLK